MTLQLTVRACETIAAMGHGVERDDHGRRRLTATERQDLLDLPLVAVWSTLTAAGRIHSVPVHFVWASGELRVLTEWDSVKCRNAVRTGRATLCVETTLNGIDPARAGRGPSAKCGVASQVMNDGSLSFVLETDRSRVWHTLVSAFFDDPVERWLYPGDSEYLSQFPRLLDAFGGDAFNKQTVWSLDDSAAVAVWFPPDADLDGDAVVAVLTQTVSPSKHQDALVVLDQMASAHPPGLYWYLPWLGVRRSRQGQGLGGQLLKRCLQRVDADHLPAYLDTPNPRNLSLYQRCGFEIVKVAQAGECPPVTCMLRPAQ